MLVCQDTEREQFVWCAELLKPQAPTTLAEWAEQRIRLPEPGPYAGRPFRHDRHPVSLPWFSALDSKRWQRYALTGPGQNGKSQMGFVIPSCYALFELAETVFVGIPDMRLAAEKWEVDFLPTITASFPDLLPTRGAGSKGGKIDDAVTFRNGARLKFMSAGQGDAGLAGPTTRNLVMSEVDKYDTARTSSREADPIRQMEARTNAFREFGRRIILECTASIPQGAIWQAITTGTDTRLFHPCPHCRTWASWDREHLTNWQNAGDEYEARDSAVWKCEACQQTFGEAERRAMHQQTITASRGQEVTADGRVIGNEPKTETFGLRWTAFDNPFVSTGRLAQDEWKGANALDRETEDKALCQFIWGRPYKEPDASKIILTIHHIRANCRTGLDAGVVPDDTVALTCGSDVQLNGLHTVTIAWSDIGAGAIIDFGFIPFEGVEGRPASDCERHVLNGLQSWWEWTRNNPWGQLNDEPGQGWTPDFTLIDANWKDREWGAQPVYSLAVADGFRRVWPCIGKGNWGPMKPSNKPGSEVIPLPRINLTNLTGIWVAQLDADAHKLKVHHGFAQPSGQPGSLALYNPPRDEAGRERWQRHQNYAAHILSEEWQKQLNGTYAWVPEGSRPGRKRYQKANHYLDATAYAVAAWNILQFQTEQAQRKAKPKPRPEQPTERETDARPWLPQR